ncbi:hypothetical protein DSCO28_19890 [Desulfosarcina ovata subsp. sediminis]|uniref:Uncharacterized protein n=1 Tax=Desulfosarcina ovata subsp. sediminis TaxID=885957 RepID=A0A5K7ZRF3_9BACT|nr:hypothetical protein DSCO28_19890 [Desulfosarcina ovata subsp. sediminis]
MVVTAFVWPTIEETAFRLAKYRVNPEYELVEIDLQAFWDSSVVCFQKPCIQVKVRTQCGSEEAV